MPVPLPEPLKAQIQKLPPFRQLYGQIAALRETRECLRAELAASQTERDVLRVRLAELGGDEAEVTRMVLERFGEFPPFVPNGHFYSPIPSRAEISRDQDRIFQPPPSTIAGIDLNEAGQLRALDRIAAFYGDLPFHAGPTQGLRYYYDNPYFAWSDAIFLYGMIRLAQPRRIVEIGSGFSSCVTLDTNERWFRNSIECTLVEPYPDRLLSLLRLEDRQSVRIQQQRAQDADPALFASLEANDVLFIDSTHVSKTGSDVNHLFFNVLPSLRPGVYVHVHDIFYPFEYPRSWIEEGRAWNELYLVRAFLHGSREFEITLFTSYLAQMHRSVMERRMPLALKSESASLWLRKM